MTVTGWKLTMRLAKPGWVLLALGAVLGVACPVRAQSAPQSLPTQSAPQSLPTLAGPLGLPTLAEAPSPAASGNQGTVTPVGCAACAGGVLGNAPGFDIGGGSGGCADGCCGPGPCYPGHKSCDCGVNSDTICGRLFGGIYQCVCCPDPCYEGSWNILADAAFFVDGARPITQIRVGGDVADGLAFPDRSEYFWARADGMGKGPQPPGTVTGARSLDYSEGSLYMEGAIDRVGAFVQMNYLSWDSQTYGSGSGLGDMTVGTKTLLLDCELMQFSFEFKTYIPTGNFGRGLGTGHVSLEPSLLMALKLTPTTYLQAQTAYWFPIGGDTAYEGDVFHYHLSLNQLLCHCGNDIKLVGTLEFNGYEFLNGEYTVPTAGTAVAGRAVSVGNVFNCGPGIRLDVCDKMDFGAGTAFALGGDRLTNDLLRLEFRYRF